VAEEGKLILTDEHRAPAVPDPTDLLSVIARIAMDPRADVEKLERLLAMQERVMADQRKIAYKAAMNRLQSRLPQIDKYGRGKNSKFAKLEDIDTIVRPLLAEEGFSVDMDEESRTNTTVTFVMTISHREGHEVPKHLTLTIDAAAKNQAGISVRPPIQDDGSTVSYARRYLLKMHLNLIEKKEDTDGESLKPITADQVLEINTMLVDTKSDKAKFLKLIAGTDSIEAIPARDFRRVMNALEEKRRHQK
jgi:ERF superfamily